MSTPDTSTLPDSALGHHEPDPRRWLALALVCVAFFMTVLDGTIVTVALPAIKNALHVSDSTSHCMGPPATSEPRSREGSST